MQRNSGLSRTTPLRPGKDYTGLKRASLTVVRDIGSAPAPKRKPARDTGFPATVKLQCRKRAGNGVVEDAKCEACGIWLGRYGGQIQHRLARGSGGSSLPIVASVVNAALLCGTPASGCHGRAEDRDEEMRAWGFWLKHGDGWPDEVPIMLHSEHGSGITVWLSADGEYGNEPPMGGAA